MRGMYLDQPKNVIAPLVGEEALTITPTPSLYADDILVPDKHYLLMNLSGRS